VVDTANCGRCAKSPEGGDKSCPIKELFHLRSQLERHDCGAFKPFSDRQLKNRAPKVKVDQGSLF
jgi:hypothetical protein